MNIINNLIEATFDCWSLQYINNIFRQMFFSYSVGENDIA